MRLFLFVAMAVMAGEYRNESGFRLQAPEGWRVQKFDAGVVMVHGPGAGQFVLVLPMLGRTRSCAAALEANLKGGWQAFPDASDVRVEPVARGAVARFLFRKGQSKGLLLCAETSARTGMLYGMAAGAGVFAREQAGMAGILKSFQYVGGAPVSASALPRFTKWREPNEGAYLMPVPEGWKAQGGVQRLSNTDIRGSIRVWSPDGASLVQFNDVRLDKVLVMGRQPMPAAQMGRGWRVGAHQSGLQMAEWYVRQVWAGELGLSGLEITARQDRPDLGAAADEMPRRMGVRGVQHLFGEVSFRATRQGRPVEGRLLGMTRMMWSPVPDLAGGSYETEVKGFVGPAGTVGQLAGIGGYMEGHVEYNYQWVAANRQAATQDVQATMAQMRASGEMQQRAFWDRMAAADARREGVNDVLGGRVRLRDGEGNSYEAKAGSNFYFYDAAAGRVAGKRDDAVVGTDVYPGAMVDLRMLEVVR